MAPKNFRLERGAVKPDDPLLPSKNGARLGYGGLVHILKSSAKEAGVPVPGAHDFRRAFALNCLRNGVDIYSLQKLMGHADLQVLRRYLKQTNQDLCEAHRKGSPVDNGL